MIFSAEFIVLNSYGPTSLLKASILPTTSIKKYEDLTKFVLETWDISRSIAHQQYKLLTKMPSIGLIITTIFDKSIETAYEKYESKRISMITGIESTNYSYRSLSDKNPTLLKILGTIEKPETLHLSEETMFMLREGLTSSDQARKFLLNTIEDKTIVLLGYESKDQFDKFFCKLVNDVSYELELPITKDMYFVNDVRYDRYYGLWENIKPENIIAIDLDISKFLRELSGVLTS